MCCVNPNSGITCELPNLGTKGSEWGGSAHEHMMDQRGTWSAKSRCTCQTKGCIQPHISPTHGSLTHMKEGWQALLHVALSSHKTHPTWHLTTNAEHDDEHLMVLPVQNPLQAGKQAGPVRLPVQYQLFGSTFEAERTL